jgi:hypothetical protein
LFLPCSLPHSRSFAGSALGPFVWRAPEKYIENDKQFRTAGHQVVYSSGSPSLNSEWKGCGPHPAPISGARGLSQAPSHAAVGFDCGTNASFCDVTYATSERFRKGSQPIEPSAFSKEVWPSELIRRSVARRKRSLEHAR